jgi:hypothetical protein
MSTKLYQAVTGSSEAGQNISNIPKTPLFPDRAACLRNYYSSLGADVGRVSQQVTAEANRRGISPFDVVSAAREDVFIVYKTLNSSRSVGSQLRAQ